MSTPIATMPSTDSKEGIVQIPSNKLIDTQGLKEMVEAGKAKISSIEFKQPAIIDTIVDKASSLTKIPENIQRSFTQNDELKNRLAKFVFAQKLKKKPAVSFALNQCFETSTYQLVIESNQDYSAPDARTYVLNGRKQLVDVNGELIMPYTGVEYRFEDTMHELRKLFKDNLHEDGIRYSNKDGFTFTLLTQNNLYSTQRQLELTQAIFVGLHLDFAECKFSKPAHKAS